MPSKSIFRTKELIPPTSGNAAMRQSLAVSLPHKFSSVANSCLFKAMCLSQGQMVSNAHYGKYKDIDSLCSIK